MKVWPSEDHPRYFRAFLNVRELWVYVRGYCPIQDTPTY